MQEVENHTLEWENIAIDIIYKPDYFISAGVSHLEVKAETPLPFTETGYRSIWLMKGEFDGGDIVQYVKDALNHDSKNQKWKDYLERKQAEELARTQLTLF
tara:strand:+ start:69940 stop:70242 length:303 start_codon:yes stop_codon:yes gene_type:complete